jgi:hypothetical protein
LSWFERSRISHTAVYRFESEIPPILPLRLKIEINTREHLSVLAGFALSRRHGLSGGRSAVPVLW